MKNKLHQASTLNLKKADKPEQFEQQILSNQGQILITQSQILWTQVVHDSLTEMEKGQGKGLSKVAKDYKKKLDNVRCKL